MIEQRNCTGCGLPLPIIGGKSQSVCGECIRGRKRKKERALVVCLDCGVVFPPANHTGLPPERCDPCRVKHKRERDAIKSAAWRASNPDRHKEHQNKSNRKRLADPAYVSARRIRRRELQYGLTQAEFDAMLSAQGDTCAICGNGHVGVGAQLHVDHDHATGAVRALLCGKCNPLIGLANDSPEILELAAAYLRRYT